MMYLYVLGIMNNKSGKIVDKSVHIVKFFVHLRNRVFHFILPIQRRWWKNGI